MIVPSIDLMDGKVVQLRQGKEHVLTDERDPVELAKELNRYGEIGVIDLDAAMGKGSNLELVKAICRVADVRAGGGIRDVERARELLRAGAKRIIIGTAATEELLSQLPKERVMVALDHWQGTVVDQGWANKTGESVVDRAKRLQDYCGSFLCTFVAEEGGMKGLPVEEAFTLQKELKNPITFAGGVSSTDEVVALSKAGLDVQVGMALYTGKLDPADAVVNTLDFEKQPLIPTIVQDSAGQVLMLAYSSPESLKLALSQGKGIYYSRSRNEIWEKGKTSGNMQNLLSCRVDCDRDTILFKVEQEGPACHTEAYSCFGSGFKNSDFSVKTLFDVLKERKANLPEKSYSAKLFKDADLLKSKILEEADEVVTAPTHEDTIWEIADVVYFLSVLAVRENIAWSDVEAELGGRVR